MDERSVPNVWTERSQTTLSVPWTAQYVRIRLWSHCLHMHLLGRWPWVKYIPILWYEEVYSTVPLKLSLQNQPPTCLLPRGPFYHFSQQPDVATGLAQCPHLRRITDHEWNVRKCVFACERHPSFANKNTNRKRSALKLKMYEDVKGTCVQTKVPSPTRCFQPPKPYASQMTNWEHIDAVINLDMGPACV